MSGNRHLDCVIIGHNEVEFGSVVEDLRKTDSYSGAYRDLKANSVDLDGKRVNYMTLLNRCLMSATGRDHALHMGRLPHLGSLYIKSFLSRRGVNAEMVNSFNFDRDLLAQLLDEKPNAVAITTTLYVEHSPIVEIIDFVKRRNLQTKVIVGGPHIFNLCSTQEEEALDFVLGEIGADAYIFDSQGELTLACLLNELRNPKPDLSRVPNLLYPGEGDAFNRTNRIIEDNDMDENVIDWSRFEIESYTPGVQIRTARSCAFSCSFCKYPAMAGRLNLVSLPLIERELQTLNDAGASHVVFIDDTFNVPFPRFKEICRMMIKNKFDFDWYSFFRCSNSDDEAFDLMERSRCKGVFLGLESGDPGILTNMNKFSSVEKYRVGIRRLKERNITTFASIIVGFPGETEASVRNTIAFLEETSPMFYRAELYYHYTNVPIHQRAAEFGIRGAGYSWKHNSMDWRTASRFVEEIYSTIKGPSVLPGYMFDFWSIPYLRGQGFSVDQIKKFAEIAQEILVKGLNESPVDYSLYEGRLTNVFRDSAGYSGTPPLHPFAQAGIHAGATE